MRLLLILALPLFSMTAMADRASNQNTWPVAQNRSLTQQAMENMIESSRQPTIYEKRQESQQKRELHQQQMENMRLQNELLRQKMEIMRQQQ